TFALLTAQVENPNTVFAATSLYAPGSLQASPSGRSGVLTWTAGQNGSGYKVLGLGNGTNSTCPASTSPSYTAIGTATTLSYTDTNRSPASVPQGTWYCYQVQTTYQSWSSVQSNPVAGVQVGVVATGVQLININAGTLDTGDQFIFTFNQSITPSTGPATGNSVCSNSATGTLWLGSTATSGGCATTETVNVGKLTGGTLDQNTRWAATYAWSNSNTKLTVTLGSRTAGNRFPNISQSTWTFTPTTTSTKLLSTAGSFHICDSNTGGGNCTPTLTTGTGAAAQSASRSAPQSVPADADNATATATATATASPTKAMTATPTPSPTPTRGPASTNTVASTPTPSATLSPTATATATTAVTATGTATSTDTATLPPTATVTTAAIATRTATVTATETTAASPTAEATATSQPTQTATGPCTGSPTATPTIGATGKSQSTPASGPCAPTATVAATETQVASPTATHTAQPIQTVSGASPESTVRSTQTVETVTPSPSPTEVPVTLTPTDTPTALPATPTPTSQPKGGTRPGTVAKATLEKPRRGQNSHEGMRYKTGAGLVMSSSSAR
ncbi:MAG TPA: hypothetical protein VGE04_12360, partial [Chloroflexia bacterium]